MVTGSKVTGQDERTDRSNYGVPPCVPRKADWPLLGDALTRPYSCCTVLWLCTLLCRPRANGVFGGEESLQHTPVLLLHVKWTCLCTSMVSILSTFLRRLEKRGGWPGDRYPFRSNFQEHQVIFPPPHLPLTENLGADITQGVQPGCPFVCRTLRGRTFL